MSSKILGIATTRRALLGGLTTLTALAAAPALASSPTVIRGAGQFRKLSLVNDRTGEWLNTVYWADGEYIPDALVALNHILRDWREDRACRMDARVLDILAATHAGAVMRVPEPSLPLDTKTGTPFARSASIAVA